MTLPGGRRRCFPGPAGAPAARTSADDLEGAAPVAAETEDGEVLVEGGGAKDAEPLHDREARAVDDREVLIRKALADRERDLEVGGSDRLDRGGAGPNRL